MKCDFYINPQAVAETIDKLDLVIQDIISNLKEVEAIIAQNDTKKLWKGKTWDSFLEQYNQWHELYYQKISELILFQYCLV
ncbi:hypothetical protein, partial [Anaeromicropila populeti]